MTFLLRITAILGLLLFGGLLVLLTTIPDIFERSAIAFTKAEVTREVTARYPDLVDLPASSRVREGLGRLSERLGVQQENLDALAASDFPETVGLMVESICSCGAVKAENATARAQSIRASMQARSAALGWDQTRLADIIRGQYEATVAALRQDLTIFLSVNALAFAAVFGATFVPRERRHTVSVPAALLVLATIVSASIYILGTDWFYAIIFQNYVGVGYGVGLLVIFAFLSDIVVNRARVTLNIIGNLPSALVPPGC